jgi:hypothetical protein
MRPAHDLSNLIKWLSREDWRPLLEEVMAEHFGPAMEAFDMEFEDIDKALGGNWGTTLWGCAFEDFLTRRFEPDGRNPVETYLKRRGWKESAAALHDSAADLGHEPLRGQRSHPRAVLAGARSDPGRRAGAGERALGDPGPKALGSDWRADRAARGPAGPGRRAPRLHPGRIGFPHHHPPGRLAPRGRTPAAREGEQASSRDADGMGRER